MAALISIGIGAVVLNVLGNNPPPAGAFSLSEYYHLTPIEKVISSNIARPGSNWECIKVGYSGTNTDDIDQRPSLSTSVNYDALNYHFIVCNGVIGGDGQIQPTPKWQKQRPIKPARTRYAGQQIIRICIITDCKITCPTEFQIKRTAELVDALSRRFDIQSASIHYPYNWWW
ncbi:MAG: hypothetical protein ACYSSI_06615 [Planctomycetota bacterium]